MDCLQVGEFKLENIAEHLGDPEYYFILLRRLQ